MKEGFKQTGRKKEERKGERKLRSERTERDLRRQDLLLSGHLCIEKLIDDRIASEITAKERNVK